MSDSDFAGLVRQSRERLGLTSSRVAELIGRSPGTVRAWEKGTSRPTEDSVVSSLAAVLGIDEGALFEAAGLEPPVMESSPSMRQALSTLMPRRERVEPPRAPSEDFGFESPDGEPYDGAPREVQPGGASSPTGSVREPERRATTLDAADDQESTLAEPVSSTATRTQARSGRTNFTDRLRAATVRRAPRPTGTPSTLPPVPTAPSYMEDANERWSYRLRGIYTAIGVVLLVIVLGWAATNLIDSLGQLWSELTANL